MATYKLQIIVEGQDRASGPLGRAGSSLQRMGEIAGGIVAAGLLNKIAGGLSSIASAGFDFGKEAVLSAARVEEMAAVISVLAKNAGIAQKTVDDLVESIKAEGITTQVAQELTAKFIQFKLNMADATTLAKVAQDAAVISMTDSSEALAGLMHGITTMNTRVLRTYGITLASTIDAQDIYAESLGKTREQLTITEKQQAVLNAVIAAGANIQGAYQAAMNTAGKQLRSMKRHVVELLNNVGAPFLEAFAGGVGSITDFIKGLRRGTEEGMPLANILETISDAFGGLGDVMGPIIGHFGLVLSDGETMSDWLTEMSPPLREIVRTMGEWLAGVLENLPETIDKVVGAISGFVEIGLVLINYFGAILDDGDNFNDWLTHLPDSIRPVIETLGAILVPFVTLGDVIGSVIGFVKNFIETGEWMNEFFDELPESIRPTVQSIAEFVTVLIEEVPKAIDKVVTWFGEHLAPIIEEVAGLVGDIIEVFLEWVGIAVDDLTPGLEDASGGILAFVEGALTQLRDILVDVRDWVSTHGDALKNFFTGLAVVLGYLAGGAAIGAVLTAIGGLIAAFNPVTLLVLGIAAAVAILITAWKEDWGGIRTTLLEFWEKAEPILKEVAEWIGEKVSGAIEFLGELWETILKPAWEAIVEFAEDHLIPLFEGIWGVIDSVATLLSDIFLAIWENHLLPAFEKVAEFITDTLKPALEDHLGGPLEWLREHVLEPFIGALDGIGEAIDGVVGWLGDLKETIGGIEVPKIFNPDSPTPFETGLLGIADALRQVTDLAPSLAFEGIDTPGMAGGEIGGMGGDTNINVDIYIDKVGSQDDAQFFARQIVEEIRRRMSK